MTKNENKFKIADQTDEYVIEQLTKYDSISYEKVKKQDKANGCNVNVKW